ncbi:MAG TPA: M1 family metallopeptidase [Planctomycetota bacterium]
MNAPCRVRALALSLVVPVLAACARSPRAAPPPSAARPATSAAEHAPTALAPVEGALGIGDPYYAGIGNGGYDVEHYELVLELDLAADELVATATLRARAREPLASFALDLYGLEVAAVEVDGRAASFTRPPGGVAEDGRALPPSELVVRPAAPLDAGGAFTVLVRYSGEPGLRPDAAVPFLPGVGWARAESGVYVVSQCIGASSWYPCNDHPRDKATYSFRVTVEEPYTVAANGLLQEVVDHGERRTFHFEARDPMASYLVTLNVADFAHFDLAGPRGIPVRIYHPQDASEEELAGFRRQVEVLALLEERFGPYPFEAAGAVLSYEPLPGALECQTLPVYGRGAGLLPVIVHELAHQWFGDCVSPDLWRDMWLNEGFASYAEWLWSEHDLGPAAYRGQVTEAYRRLRRGKVGSPFDPGVGAVFSGRTYTRGAMVLHGLRQEVGDETFFRILRSWVETRHDGNGSTADFVAHAAAVAGRDLGAFFQEWLYSAVTPYVEELEPAEPGAAAPGEAGPGG